MDQVYYSAAFTAATCLDQPHYFSNPTACSPHCTFFLLLVPTVTMCGVAPQSAFDYDGNSVYTKRNILTAYPSSHHPIVEEFYQTASDLTSAHDLLPKYGKYNGSELAAARKMHSQTLASRFMNRLTIQGHPEFLDKLSLGVITYGGTLFKGKIAAGNVRITETPAKEERERSTTTQRHIKDESGGPTVRNRSLFTHPPNNWPEWGLKDFELNCLPYRNSVHRIGILPQGTLLREV